MRTRLRTVPALLALGATAIATPVRASEAWSTRASLPEPRQEVAVAELAGRVYVIGGFRGDSSIADTVEVYDPETDSWTLAAPLPTTIHHATAVAVNGRIYVIGGWPDFFVTPLATVYEYDPGADTWTPRAPMPTARGSPAAAALDGKVYVAGGWPAERSNDFAVYDPAANSWTVLAPMPTARNHLGAAAAGGKFYAAGGRTSIFAGTGNVDAHEEFDPQSGTWSPRAPLPSARGGLAVTAVDRFVLAFGGEGNADDPDGVFEDADAYDTATDSWTSLTPMPTPRHGIGAAVLGQLVSIPGGGPVEGFGVTGVHEVYDPSVELNLALPVRALPRGLWALFAGLLLAAALGAQWGHGQRRSQARRGDRRGPVLDPGGGAGGGAHGRRHLD